MKILNGTELAGYITERQAKQVRNLRQSWGIAPRLAIIQTTDDPVIETYVRMKQRYGEDILVDVEVHRPSSDEVTQLIAQLNQDTSVHGIIVQLPLAPHLDVEKIVNSVAVSKDVDGLASGSNFVAATAQAIDWLLNGYNIDIAKYRVAIIGNGRLVGAPLASLWRAAGYDVTVFDEHSNNMKKQLRRYGVIVSAAGVPALVVPDMVQPGAVLVDAATSAEHGKIVGDISDDVRLRSDVTITPVKGGVGPLTVASLFDNVIRAARSAVEATKS